MSPPRAARWSLLLLLLSPTIAAEPAMPASSAELQASYAAAQDAYQNYDFVGALAATQRALELARASGDEAEIARAAHLTGRMHMELGDAVEAEALLQPIIDGAADPLLRARARRDLAQVRWDTGRRDEAIALLTAAELEFASLLPADALELSVGVRGHLIGWLEVRGAELSRQGRVAAGVALLERAVESETGWGAPSARLLCALGDRYLDAGRATDAAGAYARAIETFSDDGEPNGGRGEALIQLGIALRQAGDLDAAAEAIERATAELRLARGDAPEALMWPITELAVVRAAQGRLGDAIAALRAQLAVLEEHGVSAYALAPLYNTLGVLLGDAGDHVGAVAALERAVALFGDGLPAERARYLNNLAVEQRHVAGPAAAVPNLREALALREAALGPAHPLTAGTRANLGYSLLHAGDRAEAEALLTQALAERVVALGPDHPDTATARVIVAELRVGELGAEALVEAEAALAAVSRVRGAQSADTAAVATRVAAIALAVGRADRAFALLDQAAEVEEAWISQNLALGESSAVRALLRDRAATLDQAVDLALRGAPDRPEAAALALETLLRRKGRALDAEARGSALALADPELRAAREALRVLTDRRAQLVHASFADAEAMAGAARSLSDLDAQIVERERQIAARVRALGLGAAPVTVPDIAARLPPGATLVEWTVWRPASPELPATAGPARLAIFTLRADGAVAAADLGPLSAVAEATERLRAAILGRKPWEETADALARAAFGPLGAGLAQAETVLLSPDGPLLVAPLSLLLPDRPARLLGSGRDLLPRDRPAAPPAPPLVLADVDFSVAEESATADTRGSVWASLPGTRVEGRAARDLLPGARLWTGATATAPRLKAERAPLVLHIASHGFFLGGAEEPAPDTRGVALAPDRAAPRAIADPLLQTGVVLAGANDPLAREDGLLTAAELAGMDLHGTALVVLSACETGLGATVTGEGVFGLRRALVVAGSESQILSLWKVDDRATAAWMTAFYEALAAGRTRQEAWLAASAEVRSHRRWADPWYWAAFTLSGDGGPVPLAVDPG